MFNKKINNLIICAMLMSIVFLMALYSIEEVQSVQVGERTITDANGNSVTINGTIDSIITLNTDAAEAVRLLGAEHKIIGISHHIQKDYRFFPMIHTKPVVSRWREPLNIEDILTVSRDYNNTILLTYSRWSPNPEDLEDKLIGKEHNITVVRLDFYRPETLANEIKQLGIVLKCHPGTQDRATQYIEMHDNIVNQIKATVAEIPKNERPLVFTGSRPVGDLEWRAAGIGTSTYGLAKKAGANNIITDEGWHNIELEFLIRERPEKVMLWGGMGGYGTDCTARLRDERFEPFINAPGMKTIPAVPYNVFVFDSDTGTSPAFFVTLAMLVEWWHPEKFDLCHLTIHQEYLDRFHPNLGFDVRKQGAFYYHRIPVLIERDPGVEPPAPIIELIEIITIPQDIIKTEKLIEIETIEAEIPKLIEIEKTNIMEITLTTITDVSDVPLRVQQLTERPGKVIEPPDIVYQYFSITTGIKSEYINNATIKFNVSKSWINKSNISVDSIRFNRFNMTNESWDILPTRYIKGDEYNIIFSAETSHFSIFAVTGTEKIKEFIALEEIPSEKEEILLEEEIPSYPAPRIPGFGLVATILAFIGVTLLFKKNKN